MFEGAASETVDMTGLTKDVQLQLVNGKKYDVIFWASADAVTAPSKFNETTQVATLPATVNSNEADDAFFAKAEIEVTGNSREEVKLYRPYAQLNIGTDDYAAAAASGYVVTRTQVTVDAYSQVNLASGDVVGTPTSVTYAYADIPEQTVAGDFPTGAAYKYLSMSYVLVPVNKTLADVAFDYTDGTTAQSRTFTSVPLQRNYRTNIYGSLLTNSVDFNVEINPAFEVPDNNLVVTPSQLDAAVATPGAQVKLADNVQLPMPSAIAENVTIEGGTNSMLTIPNGHLFPSHSVTFKDVTIARDDSHNNGEDGCYMKIQSNNVVLDNVKFTIINVPNPSGPNIGGGIYLAADNLTLTVKNMDIPVNTNYGVFTDSQNCTINVENCTFSDKFYMNILFNNVDETNPGHGKVVAKDCTFNGAIFGVVDGTFENCKFDRMNRGDWYPVYESLGSATFKNCVFGKYGLRFTEGDSADQAPFNYDYIVCSEAVGGVFDFQNCRYSTGAAVDTDVFVISYDGYPSKVTINGTEYTDMSVFGVW